MEYSNDDVPGPDPDRSRIPVLPDGYYTPPLITRQDAREMFS